jgi:hypothetical protein
MRRSTALFATLTTGFILGCILTGLAVSLNQNDLCDGSVVASGRNGATACELASLPARDSSDLPTPTLAPPRPDAAAERGPSSNELVKGQPVFLKVETDQNEIEVGWATP